ncbi:STAS domain-containing protein [Acaryochloris sp. IP29b_bin.137]|uniref:STAS domain-containing protein n=1 Tax=Acaryochloris sp. IP29b_bin.137 TaxID=2969217 RepID=UPI00261BE346|nr:STAS domain-containing protein [Acaryochloris sp. IP29b_bin.137]
MNPLPRFCIVTPPQALTASTQAAFYQHIDELVQSQVEVILINLEKVSCLDSRGLGILFGAFRISKCRGKRLMLYSPQTHVNSNLHRTGLTAVVSTYASLADCIKAAIPSSQGLTRHPLLQLPQF